MSIDPYSLCPCGSGKKLKFCCIDLASDIERIHRMIEGDQPHAAQRHVEQTLASHPGRASLLDLQAILELSLNELDKAQATIRVFLQAHPNNPSALANQALLLTKVGGGVASVAPLQQALSAIGRDMPQRVLEAIGAVGHALLTTGHVVAAQAHLWLYTAIAPKDDTRALELLVNLNQSAGLPILLRERMKLRDWPTDMEWKDEAEVATKLADRGRWQQAMFIVDDLGQKHGADPALVYNRAILGGWLGDDNALVNGLHAFARFDVPFDDAVEAEAIAQLLDHELADATFDIVKRVYGIKELDQLQERLSDDRRIESYDLEPEATKSEDGPAPQATFLLLDRESPESGAEITREQIPSVLSFVSLFGRQTDRAERLELLIDRSDSFEAATQAIAEIAGDTLADEFTDEVIGQSSQIEQALSWRWHFPADTPPILRRTLLANERSEAITSRWPEVSRASLEGKSPREAATDPELRIALAATVLVLEQGSNNFDQGGTVAKLRENLKMDAPQSIDPEEYDIADLPVVRIPRVKLSAVEDEPLVQLYRRAMLTSSRAAIRATCLELLNRPNISELVPVDEIYGRLVPMEPDPAKALELINQARVHADEAGESTARWDIAELEFHFSEGNIEEAKRTLGEIDERHRDNPEVAAAVYQLLYEVGVLQPEDLAADPAIQPGMPPPDEFTTAGQTGAGDGGIWTPDSESPAGGEKKSKLWTPS